MGLIHITLSLSNPVQSSLGAVVVEGLVNRRGAHLCIPESLARQLALPVLAQHETMMADGTRRSCPFVGPLKVRYGDRECTTGAVVLGRQVLLGLVPMEAMGLYVDMAAGRVEVGQERGQ